MEDFLMTEDNHVVVVAAVTVCRGPGWIPWKREALEMQNSGAADIGAAVGALKMAVIPA